MSEKFNIVNLVRDEARRSASEPRRSKSAHRAKFLFIKDDVAELLYSDKFTAQFIWKTLKDKNIINCSYTTFLKYCKDYIPKNQQKSVQDDFHPSSKMKKNEKKTVSISPQPQQSFSRFIFDRNPNEKDLI